MKDELSFLSEWNNKFLALFRKNNRLKNLKLQNEAEFICKEKKLQAEAKILIERYYEEVGSFMNPSTLPGQISRAIELKKGINEHINQIKKLFSL